MNSSCYIKLSSLSNDKSSYKSHRIYIDLFYHDYPKLCNQFRDLCTEKKTKQKLKHVKLVENSKGEYLKFNGEFQVDLVDDEVVKQDQKFQTEGKTMKHYLYCKRLSEFYISLKDLNDQIQKDYMIFGHIISSASDIDDLLSQLNKKKELTIEISSAGIEEEGELKKSHNNKEVHHKKSRSRSRGKHRSREKESHRSRGKDSYRSREKDAYRSRENDKDVHRSREKDDRHKHSHRHNHHKRRSEEKEKRDGKRYNDKKIEEEKEARKAELEEAQKQEEEKLLQLVKEADEEDDKNEEEIIQQRKLQRMMLVAKLQQNTGDNAQNNNEEKPKENKKDDEDDDDFEDQPLQQRKSNKVDQAQLDYFKFLDELRQKKFDGLFYCFIS